MAKNPTPKEELDIILTGDVLLRLDPKAGPDVVLEAKRLVAEYIEENLLDLSARLSKDPYGDVFEREEKALRAWLGDRLPAFGKGHSIYV